MVQLIIFVIFTVLAAAALAFIIFLSVWILIAHLRNKNKSKQLMLMKRTSVFLAVFTVIDLGLICFSQIFAATPKISGANSISELISLDLNGRKQWISLRSEDKNNPVLLFLAGGPGGTQMAAVRHELGELEKHFVVVNWDQPGSGKSYNAKDTNNITVDTYIDDGYALTQYLKERFSQEKIYLIGESWGSALGVFLVGKYPASYHALIGTGQMVDFAETERIDYQKALELARANGDTAIVKSLEANGPAPYNDGNIAMKSAVYLNYLNAQMLKNPQIHNAGYNTFRDIGSGEYGIIDKINYFLALLNTFNHVYPQLYGIDLREDYTKLDVPVYFFLGRHDLNAPVSLAEEYIDLLDAPVKRVVLFEHSGHSPWINERDKFVEETLSCLLQND